jgi:hypothetical protein
MIVKIEGDGSALTKEEIDNYKKRAIEKYGNGCGQIDISVDGDFVDIGYHIVPFERVRRITGYLVGTLDRWNDAKRAEEHDRVKHSL